MVHTAGMPDVDVTAARAALRRAGERLAVLIESASDAAAPIPGMEWTVGELAAHVAVVSEVYTGYATGDTEPFVDVTDVAGGSLTRSSAARLAAEPERDVRVLAQRLRAGLAGLEESTEAMPPDAPVIWNGQQVSVSQLVGLALGEVLIHGLDLSRAVGCSWTISADEARVVLVSVLPLLPLLVNPATTSDVDVSYDLRVRRGARVGIRIDRGTLTFREESGRVDCHVSADPVALLLVAYGRRSQWVPALTGKLLAWGRKPWLGLRLTSYLVTP
jgi:uncharacterized protein (TIGR03083 family)